MSQIAGIVFAFAGLLGLVALLPPLAQRLHVPYTVLLAGLGIVLGVLIGVGGGLQPVPFDEIVIDFLRALGGIEITSGVFLWVLLPLLLFQSAFELDTRALWDDIGHVLLMAVVAVVATTLIAGLPVAWGSGMEVPAALLVAAIIATTDPVAVIAVFREVGAPQRLVSLVEGESLLNDAAAIALTTSLLSIVVSGMSPSLGDMAAGFLWDFVGGGLFGAALGRLAAILISRLDEGGPAETTVSVALAYLAYALGEIYLGVSGVVATVAAGLVFGSYARYSLPATASQTMSAIWGQLSFWGASLIFVLASMLIPRTLAGATAADLGLLLLLIAGAFAARGLVLFGLMPPLRVLGLAARVQPAFKLVMLWGGLRGAVTLALALAVTENAFVPEAVQRLVAVLATGFVLFTLIVQGTTLRLLIRWLGLDQLSPAERFLRDRALRLTHGEIVDRLSEAARGHGLDGGARGDIDALYRRRVSALPQEPTLPDEMLRVQLVTALLTLTRKELELYVEERARRMASRPSSLLLVRQASTLIDSLRVEGLEGYRRLAREQLRPGRYLRLAAWLHRRFRIDRPLAIALGEQLERALVQRFVLSNLLAFNAGRVASLFGGRISESAGRFLSMRRDVTERTIEALRLQYPDYWRAFSERYLSLAALRLEEDAFEQMADERLLVPQIIDRLRNDLRRRRRDLERPPALDLRLDTVELVRHVPLFADFNEAQAQGIARLLTTRLALPNERIVRRGEQGNAMYFIASGAVEVRLLPEPVRLGTGDFFGEMALLHDRPRLADVVAIGYCRLLVLRREQFERFLRNNPELEQQMRRIARQRAG